jgi:hypothetical protein
MPTTVRLHRIIAPTRRQLTAHSSNQTLHRPPSRRTNLPGEIRVNPDDHTNVGRTVNPTAGQCEGEMGHGK